MPLEFCEEGRGRQLRRDHEKFIQEVIQALQHDGDISMEVIFADDRWGTVYSTMSEKEWHKLCASAGCHKTSDAAMKNNSGMYEHVIFELTDLGHDLTAEREVLLALVKGVAPTLRALLQHM